VQLFHTTNMADFYCILWHAVTDTSCLPITPSVSPATIRNREEHHTQPIRIEEKVKNRL
jgi:hypothetical protein